jgi:hypothetical protein
MRAPDLRALDHDGFVTLVFDHPAYEGQDVEQHADGSVTFLEERPTAWYWEVEWSWDDLPADPLHTLALMAELFERAHELPERFTARQIAQGFDLLLIGGDKAFMELVWDARLPWEPRERLLRAVVPLYRWLFDVQTEIEHVPFMFWDGLLGYRFVDHEKYSHGADDARVQETVADIIREMLLVLDGPWSAPAALHGAFHVGHPAALDAVREWLARLPEPEPGAEEEHWVKYARDVLVGQVM